MGNCRKRLDKGRISFFILLGLFLLFLILSFFSINNVYGFDSENITHSDIEINNVDNSLANNLNQYNLVLYNNLDYYNESSHNISNTTEDSNDTINMGMTTPKGDGISIYNESQIKVSTSECFDLDVQFVYSDNSYLNANYKNNNAYLIDNEDNLEIGKKSNKLQDIAKLDDIDFNSFYSILQYPYSNNYVYYFNDINDYINNHIVILISNSNFEGNGFGNFINFMKEIANLNFNKIDDDNTSIIQDFQSSPKPTLTILFFIKIFMKHHDNGKEHLASF